MEDLKITQSGIEKYSKKRYAEEDVMRDKFNLLMDFVMKTIPNEMDDIVFSSKAGKREEWGYIPGHGFPDMMYLIKKYNINNICDLGSGLGIGPYLLSQHSNVQFHGIDNEELFVKYANKLLILSKLKDITTLTKEDISCYQVLYFYEPIYYEGLAFKFIDNLVKIMDKNQYIFYECAGCMEKRLYKYVLSNKLLYIGKTRWLHVYKKL